MKVCFFAFKGDAGCLLHAFLNAIEMKEAGEEAKIIFEGQSTALLPEMFKKDSPLSFLYQRASELGIVAGACKACSQKAGTLPFAQEKGFNLLSEMKGHPSMMKWIKEGFVIITI